jgi:D-glycero-alpha-D-manno-heptose-7-phosphate kinase
MIITRAPMRISFFGGGTDFPEHFIEHGGAVLSTAIDKYTCVTASHFHSHLFGYDVRLSYSKGELAAKVDDIQHPVFRECLRFCDLSKDLELHTVADLPSFTGLGTSSSFTVALLLALHAYKGEFVSGLQIAYEAIHVERHMLKECVGVQDQVASAVGGFNIFEFRAEDDICVHPVRLQPSRLKDLENHLLLIFTNIKRRAADVEKQKVSGFSQQRANLAMMRRMVDTGYELLTDKGSFEEFGRLLDNAWQAKRALSSAVTNNEIETMYQTGLANGAWGGKLLGAGGGGFLLFCAPPERHARICAALQGKHRIEVSLAAPGAAVIFSSGFRQVN